MIGEVVFNLEALDCGVIRDDLPETLAQRGNVPLAVAQLEERTALGFLPRHLESAIKGSARDENAHCLIEHDQGFANGIDDSFFQGPAGDAGFFFDTRLARNPPRRLLFPYVAAKDSPGLICNEEGHAECV